MRILDNEIKKNGFDYVCILRGLKAFVYVQHQNGLPVAYEVFKRKINKDYEIAGVQIEGGESFPGNEAFGKWAWSYKTEADAINKFQDLENG
jgi:hypothetical protein